MKVRVLRRAQTDLLEIAAWLERERPVQKNRILDAVLTGLERLERFPRMGPLARDPLLRRRGYRTLVRQRYVAFYRVERATVLVVRVLHERQSWKRLL
jgi:plasmid stabilization system protein ParE